jgi:hypothetical protein
LVVKVRARLKKKAVCKVIARTDSVSVQNPFAQKKTQKTLVTSSANLYRHGASYQFGGQKPPFCVAPSRTQTV